MLRPNKLWYLSVALIGVLAIAIGAVHIAAVQSSQSVCLLVGDQLLDTQMRQIVRAPEQKYARLLGGSVYSSAPSPNLRDTAVIYRRDTKSFGIGLLDNNLNWIDVASNFDGSPTAQWSPDGQYLAYGNTSTSADLYDIKNHQTTVWTGNWTISWPFKGDYLLLGTLSQPHGGKFWSTSEQRFVETIADQDTDIAAWLPSANSIIHVAPDGDKWLIHLIRLDTHTDLEIGPPFSGLSFGGDISADGHYLSIVLDNTIRIFDIDGHLIKTLSANFASLTPPTWAGNRLIIASSDGQSVSLTAYDPVSDMTYDLAKDVVSTLDDPTYWINQGRVAFKQPASQGIYFSTIRTDGTQLAKSDKTFPATTHYTWLGHNVFIYDSTPPPAVTWMDADTGHIHRLLKDPKDRNDDNLFNDNGRNAALIGASTTLPQPAFLYMLNMNTNLLKPVLVASNSFEAAWSPDGKFAAIFSASAGGVTVFDTDGNKRAFVATPGANPVWRSCGAS